MVRLDWNTFWAGFWPAFTATAQVFVVGGAGFWLVRRGFLGGAGLRALGRLVGLMTLPCLIFYRFATRFDPQTFPDWWKYCLVGAGITLLGLVVGKLVALRHGGNDEATLLVGFQNAGFFVLPMLQALLPRHEFERTSLLLFMLFVPFNASLWLAGSWFLLKRRTLHPRVVLTPTFCATVGTLILYGFLHDPMHALHDTFVGHVLLGGTQEGAPGALQLIGDLTVPLATLTLGGSIAASLAMGIDRQYLRAAREVTGAKLVVMPLLGLLCIPLLQVWLGREDYPVALMIMLQFCAPPAIALSVFAQQHAYPMKLIPPVCLISYTLCLLTVPFFLALLPR